jgi:hypothetical protein
MCRGAPGGACGVVHLEVWRCTWAEVHRRTAACDAGHGQVSRAICEQCRLGGAVLRRPQHQRHSCGHHTAATHAPRHTHPVPQALAQAPRPRQRTILQWHQKRPGCSMPMPVQPLYGSSHISGVRGFMPSQLYTPSTASQNLPQEVQYVAPPRSCICSRSTAQGLAVGREPGCCWCRCQWHAWTSEQDSVQHWPASNDVVWPAPSWLLAGQCPCAQQGGTSCANWAPCKCSIASRCQRAARCYGHLHAEQHAEP